MKVVVFKIIIACLSALIFAVILASLSYIPKPEQEANTYYWSYISLFALYLIYSALVFLLGGVPYSLGADVLLKKVKRSAPVRYLAAFGLYLLGGLLVTLLFLLVLSGGTIFTDEKTDSTGFFMLGMAASLLYMHVELLLKLIWKIRKRKVGLSGEESP